MDCKKIEDYLKVIEEKYQVPGGELLIKQDEDILFEGCFGDRKEQENENQDLYWLYSMSKIYTVVSAMQLWERGKLSLETPLIDYFPRLKQIQKKDQEGRELHPERIRLSNLLSMTGGLNYETQGSSMRRLRKQAKAGQQPELDQIIEAIFQDSFVYEPGTHFLYSLCHDVMGAVIQKITDLPLNEYMQKYIFDPLEIRDIGFYPDEDQKKRFAPQYIYGGENQPVFPLSTKNQLVIAEAFPSGGAGLFGNLKSYIRLPETLANGGTAGNGAQILKPETICKLREDQLIPMGVAGDFHTCFQNHGLEGYSYGLGVRTRILDTGSSPVGEFGWDGAAGGYILIDPVHHLTLGYVQHVMNMGSAYSEIHPTLRGLLY